MKRRSLAGKLILYIIVCFLSVISFIVAFNYRSTSQATTTLYSSLQHQVLNTAYATVNVLMGEEVSEHLSVVKKYYDREGFDISVSQ